MQNRFAFLAGFFALLTFGCTLSAQVMGRLTGSVVDPSGAAVPNATVSVLLAGGNAPILATVTTKDGLFHLTGIQPNFYDLVIEAEGFGKYKLRQIKVDPARETALPTIGLEVEKRTETVEVVSPTPIALNAEVATTVTNEQVRRLPLLNRDVLGLIPTQAGVNPGRGSSVINGQRSAFTNLTIDGINIQDNFIRSFALGFVPNALHLDQVAEFTITTANPDATLGGGASQVSMVTPSGTNEFRGSVYWYNRNNALAANTWFNNLDGLQRPFLNQNQLGGSLGGPILKERLFFFTNYEAFRRNQQTAVNRTILSEDARRGIFTYPDLEGNVRKVNILQAAGVEADPTIRDLLQVVPGPEKINNFRTGDSREALLRNTAGYSFLRRNNEIRDNVTAKLDYIFSTRNTLSGSFLWNRDLLDRPDLGNDYSVVPKGFDEVSRKLVAVGWRWNPTPQFTNELRGGFNVGPTAHRTSERSVLPLLQNLIFSNPVNTFQSNGSSPDTYHYMNNAGYARGKHSIQFGLQVQQIRVETFDDSGVRPTYSLGIGTGNPGLTAAQLPGIRATDLDAANAMLASLAGYVTGYSQAFSPTSPTSGFVRGVTSRRHYRLHNYAFYLQDRWKMIPRLTLSLSLRYDYYTVVDERDSLALLPRIQNNDPIATLRSNATLDFGGSSVGRPWYQKDKNNLAPTIGLAWDPLGNGKTILRAGYGISYVNDERISAVRSNLLSNGGQFVSSTRTGVSGRLGSGLPPLEAPAYKVPRTFEDNHRLNRRSSFGLPDPGLMTPYVQQWSFGIQKEWKGTVLEARYVGNHGTKMLRQFDYNQVMVREGGFLEDFQRALNNGGLARAANGVFDPNYNPALSGSQLLSVFPLLPQGGSLNNATIRGLIERGEAGELAARYQIDGRNGPLNFFPNPFALLTWLLTNYANSTYHALQIDVTRRMRGGVQFQANYTYSKVLSDTAGDGTTRIEFFRDLNNPKIERSRPPSDLTHAVKANAIVDLPLGKRHRLNFRPLERFLGGWSASGILTWQSGLPFSVLSGRGTLNQTFLSFENTANATLAKSQLDRLFELRKTGAGPYFVSASAIGTDGRAVAPDGRPPFTGQVFFHPAAGSLGGLQRRMFSGPWTFNLDFALMKNVKVLDRKSLELRMEAANVFNHPTWSVFDQNISSTNFGQVFDTFYDSRLIQFSLHYRF